MSQAHEAGHLASHLFHAAHTAERVAPFAISGLTRAAATTASVPAISSALGVGVSVVSVAAPVLFAGAAVCGLAAMCLAGYEALRRTN